MNVGILFRKQDEALIEVMELYDDLTILLRKICSSLKEILHMHQEILPRV